MEDNFRENLKNIKKIVIKVGTKILLDENNKPNKNSIQRIVEGIWKIREDHKKEVVLVTSGAIGIGMGVLGKKERPRSIPQKQAAAAVGQNKLMHLYETEFSKKNLHVGQVLITAEDLNNKMRYLNIKNTLACLLEMKIIPIINENDSVAVDEIKVGDNDTLSALVTLLIGAE
ncbi:MAG: glutamate 5-kinase, partial [Elusimicrobiota bacterium]